MSAQSILPWQQQPWRQLTARLTQDQFPHAVLLHGPDGIGKLAFAKALSQRLLCETATGTQAACGQCRSCQLLRAQSHEDFVELTVGDGRGTIGIDAVRGLIEFMNLTPRRSSRKVALVQPAEKLTLNAANSLLKTLEEPSSAAVFLLVTARPAMLPATVRSRCSKLRLGAPSEEAALSWLSQQLESPQQAKEALQRARGAPLNALVEADAAWREARAAVLRQWLQIPRDAGAVFDVAAEWQRLHGAQAMRWVYGWVADVLRLGVTGSDSKQWDNELAGALQAMVKQVDLKRLFNHLSSVERAARDLEGGSLNAQLVIESVLLEWSALFAGSPQGLPRTGT